MRRIGKKHIILSIIICVLCALKAQAQEISVSAPSHVAVGENFRIAYKINTQDVEHFRSGNVPDGLEVLAGPYTSSQSSYRMVNGHTSSSSSITYTYTLYAAKEGTYTIPAAHAKSGGRQVSSKAIQIVVSGHAKSGRNGAPQMHEDEDEAAKVKAAGSHISGSDLFIKVSANKKRVHEQEPILLTYKVYTQVQLTDLRGEMPDLTGFHTQEIPLPQQKSFHIENVNGRPYRCVTWSQYVMYPQMTGKLEIPSITFKGIVVQENRAIDPFEAFFNGGSGYVEVKKDIVAPGVTIHVDPLPAKPVNYSGGVGHFNISAQLDKKEIQAGDPITLRVVIGGVGNLKLIKQPVVNFPKDFDKYDAKVTDKTKLTVNGVEGNMIYDFLAVPRNQGKYEIPAVELTYFDTSINGYKTIKTKPFSITVDKGDGKNSSITDYSDERDKDIHPIIRGKVDIYDGNDLFYGSPSYWISLLLPLLTFIALLIIFRKRAINNADLVKAKGKRANKVATKRLKKAHSLMLQNKQGEFYDEVLRALWGYVGDKLNIPVEQLSRENIQEQLQMHMVTEDIILKFVSALDECEYERYAPGDPTGNMNKTFESAMTAIMKIEDVMKKTSKRRTQPSQNMHSYIVILLVSLFSFLCPLSSFSVTKENADAEYLKGNYQQAAKDYEELLKKGTSAELYYNLGNAYYRQDNITRAVLNYERALRLQPWNKDIRFNLQFAQSKTIDKISTESEMFFVTAYRSLVTFYSIDGWARTGIIAIVMSLVLMLVFLFSPSLIVRKIGFSGAIVGIVLFFTSSLFAYQQKIDLDKHTGAIVIAPTVNVKSTPSKGSNDEFIIHEGTRVDITDRGVNGWCAIRLADNRTGWIQTSQLEEI